MTQTHINDPAHAAHTLQEQLAAHFDEIKPLHDDKWVAVKFGRRLSEAHWRAEEDKREQARVQASRMDGVGPVR